MPANGDKAKSRLGQLGRVAVLLGFVSGLAVACSVLPDNPKKQSPNILDQVNSVDLLPRFPEPKEAGTVNRGHDARPTVYNGTDASVITPVTLEGAEPSANGGGYDLNFENAPVATVAKVILGDILGVGYVIDPRVQGTVTLQSGRPVAKSDVAYVLESALRASNVALVHEATGYRLVPSNEAIGTGALDAAGHQRPGYGVTVVPLRYVSAATIGKLVENFAARQGAVRVDEAHNLILIQGTGPERRQAVDTVMSFDADWMRGQSVGIYPLQHSAPEPIVTEVDRILDTGQGGLSHDLVKLQPIGRLNAVMVVARRPNLLNTAAMWIKRLDRSEIASTGVKVYRVRYGDARYLAKILNEMFGGGTSGASFDATANQLAPGSGTTISASSSASPAAAPLSPADRLTGGGINRTATANATSQVASALPPGGATAAASSASGGLLPGIRITADVSNNSLLIYANEENYRIIERTLQQIDRPQIQVAIDATIAEVTLNDSLTYGVQFFLKSANIGAPTDSGSIVNTIGSAALSRVLPGFNILVGSEANPQVIIDALHAVTDVKILSNPSLVVVDNGTATLQVGDQVPITTGTATVLSSNNAVVNTINYQNTGILLRVVPRVGYNNKVTLDIEQEISNVSNTSNTGTLTPTISERKVHSTLSIADGQTVLLAGLVSENQNRTRNGIPVLDQLPGYLGDAFSHQNKTVQRTELIIFIRPQIIRDNVDAHLVADQFRTRIKTRIGNVVRPGHPPSFEGVGVNVR